MQDLCSELLAWACSSLVEDSHQPSVRYLLEWLIMRLLQHVPTLEQTFLDSVTLVSNLEEFILVFVCYSEIIPALLYSTVMSC